MFIILFILYFSLKFFMLMINLFVNILIKSKKLVFGVVIRVRIFFKLNIVDFEFFGRRNIFILLWVL